MCSRDAPIRNYPDARLSEAPPIVVHALERKRDGDELTAAEIRAVIAPETPDFQVAAFLMAVLWRGLTDAETSALLDAMVDSGERLDLSAVGRPVVDKHSTGGVGDKTTLIVAPLVAACGVPIAKLSGRGLGHTGGTLDKLESIPGFRTQLSAQELIAQVTEIGIAVAGQSLHLVPADRRLYALRDATATVPSIPLIATSIMSKKLAAGARRLVLDVKVGEGAFMPDPDSARALAQTMRRLGAAAGVETLCMLTGMDEPLGAAVGNALEVDEAVATLSGHGPSDLVEVCLTAAGLLTDDRPAAERALKSGAALACYRLWVTAQGGDPDRPMERAPVVVDVPAPRAGWVSRCQARGIADVAMRLGAGRTVPGAAIDHAVGVVVHAKSGTAVEVGQPLATIHARGEFDLDAVAACFAIGDAEPQPVEPVLELL